MAKRGVTRRLAVWLPASGLLSWASLGVTGAATAEAEPGLATETRLDRPGGGQAMLPLVSVDDSARLGEKLGIHQDLATSNVFRGLLNSPSATAGFYGLFGALFYRNKVAARIRELIILRTGWRTGSEYVFCNHVGFSPELGIPDEEILGVRDPARCKAYSKIDRAVLRLADELHESAIVSPATWTVLESAFAADELVELLLSSGLWRMAAGFLKSARIPLDPGVASWPEGRAPRS